MTQESDQGSRLLWWQPQDILRFRHAESVLPILTTWAFVCALSVISGLLSGTWTGITLRLGSLSIGLTLYPPLTLCLLLTLWIGPIWGIVPAFLTSFVISLHNGMPLGTSLLFSMATPITLTVLWSSMVTLRVDASLRGWPNLIRFVVLSLVATGSSSVGALIWNYHHGFLFSKALAVWQGWLVGDFLQIVLIVAPLLYCFHRPVQSRLAARITAPRRSSLGTKFYIAVFTLVLFVMVAVGAAAGKLLLSSLNNMRDGGAVNPAVIRDTLREAVYFVAVYAVVFMASVFVFSSTLGSQVERHLRDIAERTRIQAEREKLIADLQNALAKVKLLSGMLPICANCKKIRDDKGYWKQIESYLRDHSEAEFSHSICPQCLKELYPEFSKEKETGIENGL